MSNSKIPLTEKATRRDFLATLMAVMFGLQLDPERLLWTPGKKLISIPKYYPPKVGQFLTSEMILNAAMERYEQQSIIMQIANRKWDESFSPGRLGDAVSVKLPIRYFA